MARYWRELRWRWMTWKYRYVTRNRQRFAEKRAGRSRPPLYEVSQRGLRPQAGSGYSRTGRTWLILVVTVVAMAVVRHYSTSQDLVFIVDIGLIAAAYFTWTRVTV